MVKFVQIYTNFNFIFQEFFTGWRTALLISAFISPMLARPDHSGSEIDFSKAVDDPETGLQCVTNEATVDTLERERLLECVHKSVNICHYTYVTRSVELDPGIRRIELLILRYQ